MGVSSRINKEVLGWVTLGITVVITSIVLLKFKTSNPANITCGTGKFFNATLNKCCVTGELCNAGNQSVIGSLAQSIDTLVTGFSEPKNWIAIVIIALIGFALMRFYKK